MKKVVCSLFMILSTNAFAGGGGSSWQPSVSPINCVVGTSQGWMYYDSAPCTEVINKGYARGVRYKSSFIYEDGYTQQFDVIVAPGQTASVIHDKSHGDYKFGPTWEATWVR
ncbi:CexE precursor [Escherichia coli]|uniref:hypothetical protein n=1 Tax=Escherichia coli TaxID=562 RepID=UPI00191898CC|nr:hypothetical protein [Escherichia coli]CAD6176080.1 CexE precursor [Escherichia coli]